MTNTQQLILAICFGSSIGTIIGNLIIIIASLISDIKYKRRRKKEAGNSATKAE